MFKSYRWYNAQLMEKAKKYNYVFWGCIVATIIFSFIFGGILKYALVIPLVIGVFVYYKYYLIQNQDKKLKHARVVELKAKQQSG